MILPLAILMAVNLTSSGPANSTDTPKMADPALEKMAALVGGKWYFQDKNGFKVQHTYEMAMNGKAVRGNGIIAIGTPGEMQVETLYGWDPVAKSAYYIDFHGHDSVYKGTIKAEGNSLLLDFETLIGAPGKFKARIDLVDPNTMRSVIVGKKGDTWVDLHTFEFKRQR